MRYLSLTGMLLLAGALAAATTNLPQPRQYVEDRAGIVYPGHKQSLNGLLQELEQKTGVQFIVLTVKSTRPLTIERFSMELAERWKLGRKDRDDGFLFTVAVEDRAFRFEVGYGLEGYLTDAYCGQVGRGVLTPLMQQGRPSEGVYQATLAIVDRIAQQNAVVLTGMPSGYANPTARPRGTSLCGILPVILLFVVFMTAAGRGSMFWPLWFLMGHSFGASRNSYTAGRSGYWGYRNTIGGGGFRSGGFGGFGGGMGGGFGGGGFSGRW